MNSVTVNPLRLAAWEALWKAEWDESQHPRDRFGRFADSDRDAHEVGKQADIRKLGTAAAKRAVKNLEELYEVNHAEVNKAVDKALAIAEAAYEKNQKHGKTAATIAALRALQDETSKARSGSATQGALDEIESDLRVEIGKQFVRDVSAENDVRMVTSNQAQAANASRAAAVFDTAPDGAGGAKFLKAAQAEYDKGGDFRLVADAMTLYTQGSFSEFRIASAAVAGGFGPLGSDDLHAIMASENMSQPLTALHSPISDYKAYFKGQDVTKKSAGSVYDAAIAVHHAISDSKPLSTPLYRGTSGDEDFVGRWQSFKPGEPVNLRGVTSFTTDLKVASQFSEGMNSGQNRGGIPRHHSPVVFEVLPGAKGLRVAAMSPWRQKEVVSAGEFEFVEMVKQGNGYVVKLRQRRTYRPERRA